MHQSEAAKFGSIQARTMPALWAATVFGVTGIRARLIGDLHALETEIDAGKVNIQHPVKLFGCGLGIPPLGTGRPSV
jgi:hypothetical protein